MDSLRHTGRTTRMVLDAIAAAKRGENVRILGYTERNSYELRRLASELGGGNERITYGVLNELDAYQALAMRLHSYVLFVDHYAIEQRFSAVLEMLHRYDTPQPAEPRQGQAGASEPRTPSL